MSKPLVAVVGKPNVGKSTFFNKVCGGRISIVSDMPGVTRDRIYADAEWLNKKFTLVDTGGIQLKSDDVMFRHIKEQAQITRADLPPKIGTSQDCCERQASPLYWWSTRWTIFSKRT